MKGCPPDEPTLNRFIQEISRLPPRPHHSSLLDTASGMMPDCHFRYVFSRGGWHRPGGVIRPDGTPVARDLETWLAEQLADCGDDLDEFMDRHGDDDLQVTRHAGQTHFFVAAYGPDPTDFMQLEVEEMQEVLDRKLLNPDVAPDDIGELSEPARPSVLDPQPVGMPYYRYRRLTDMRRVSARVPGSAIPGSVAPLTRFMSEWPREGAGHFSDHWVVGLSEHADRYGNPVVSAKPVSLHARTLKHFHWQAGIQGVALGDQIHAFDRAAGYPAAWYFHMVAGGLAPRELAYALMDDWVEGFRYLADRDAALLKGWVEQPYSV